MRAGWERGGDDLATPIHRATLQEAVALLELAEAIHPEPFWTWTRAGLLLRLGHYTAAAEAYGRAGGRTIAARYSGPAVSAPRNCTLTPVSPVS